MQTISQTHTPSIKPFGQASVFSNSGNTALTTAMIQSNQNGQKMHFFGVVNACRMRVNLPLSLS